MHLIRGIVVNQQQSWQPGIKKRTYGSGAKLQRPARSCRTTKMQKKKKEAKEGDIMSDMCEWQPVVHEPDFRIPWKHLHLFLNRCSIQYSRQHAPQTSQACFPLIGSASDRCFCLMAGATHSLIIETCFDWHAVAHQSFPHSFRPCTHNKPQSHYSPTPKLHYSTLPQITLLEGPV